MGWMDCPPVSPGGGSEFPEALGGEIDATVTVTYPEDYFHPKAILEVTPVIVYEGGEQAMACSTILPMVLTH